MSETAKLNHLGFIMDGNRRWAVENGMSKLDGHQAGYSALIDVIKRCVHHQIKFITVYAFSSENWQRSEQEVSRLMQLMLRGIVDDLHIFTENNVRLKFLGSRDRLSKKMIAAIENAESQTAHLDAATVGVCFNYGGQSEVVDACRAICESGVEPGSIDADLIAKYLYQSEIPPIDMVVRTSGEHRISNFMLWRAAYSELLFLDKHWPAMTPDDVDEIVAEFGHRSRRFGK